MIDIASESFSVFSWFGMHGNGTFHGAHTHLGEYVVGVYYPRVPKPISEDNESD